VPRGGKPKLDGSSIVNAAQDFNMKGDVEVMMQMDAEGSTDLEGDDRRQCGQAPWPSCWTIGVQRTGRAKRDRRWPKQHQHGNGDLNKQIQEADDLANILKAGALPAPARIIDETVVGPSLGGENIKWGMISFAIALLIVMIYDDPLLRTRWLDRRSGLVGEPLRADRLLASLQAALTLPGIAGIVLDHGYGGGCERAHLRTRSVRNCATVKMLKSAVVRTWASKAPCPRSSTRT
jgi:SecD/SecF fusion protein